MQHQFREPRLSTSLERKFHDMDTAAEDLPAMPKESSYSGMANTHPHWHDSLPQIRKVDRPYWNTSPKDVDLEKMAGRTLFIGMSLVTLLLTSIFLVKLVQFALSVTIK
jgi:hypothetical protein